MLVSLTPDQAKTLLPEHCTGFVPAQHSDYRVIQQVGVDLGKLTLDRQ